MAEFRYRPEVLEQLRRHGFFPAPHHDPRKVRQVVRDLYRFEIRDLRARLLEMERVLGPQDRTWYRREVLRLKARYGVLASEAEGWTY